MNLRFPSWHSSASRGTGLILAFIIGLAGILRTYKLGDLPAGLYCDEAAMGYNAWAISHHGMDESGATWPLFIWSFGSGYKNPAYIYPAAIPIAILGLDEFSTRLPAALFGCATILVVFALIRQAFSAGPALACAFLLAVTPWHLHMSRIAFELIAFPFFFCLGFLYFNRFVNGGSGIRRAGLFFGLCPYAYAISKLFVPLFLAGYS